MQWLRQNKLISMQNAAQAVSTSECSMRQGGSYHIPVAVFGYTQEQEVKYVTLHIRFDLICFCGGETVHNTHHFSCPSWEAGSSVIDLCLLQLELAAWVKQKSEKMKCLNSTFCCAVCVRITKPFFLKEGMNWFDTSTERRENGPPVRMPEQIFTSLR